jgi:tetratricopeptide (TPR) repeat protein
VSGVYLEQGSFGAAREAAERVLELAERHGFSSWAALALVRRGSSAFLVGEWGEARRDFAQAAAYGREIGPFWGSFFAPLSLGLLCLAEGSAATASEYLEECERLLRSGRPVPARLRIIGALAERDLRAGQPQRARARLAAVLDPDAPPEEDTTPLLPLMASALLDLANVEEAAEVATRAAAQAQEQGRQVLLADALRVTALVATRRERWEEAEAALEEGLVLARRIGYPYAEARLSQSCGELLAQTGQPKAARERLEAALAIFRRLGAHKDIERVEQTLTARI